jgi:hypothetical protein
MEECIGLSLSVHINRPDEVAAFLSIRLILPAAVSPAFARPLTEMRTGNLLPAGKGRPDGAQGCRPHRHL